MGRCSQLTMTSRVTNQQLMSLTVAGLKTAVHDRKSFAHLPDSDGAIPLRGIKNLIAELKQRPADRDYYHKWLSLLHTAGIK